MAVTNGSGFSLTRGGLLHAALVRLGLVRDDPGDVRRVALALTIASWAPMMLLAQVESALGGRPERLLHDFSVHARLLIGLPLLVWSERVLETRSRSAIDELTEARLVPDASVLERIVSRAHALRDARSPEILLLAIAALLGQMVLWRSSGTGLFGQDVGLGATSPTHVWYSLVGLPLYQFVFARFLWRWVMWCRLLWHVSRQPLGLVATHPDLAGGIAHLCRPVLAMGMAMISAHAVVAAAWAGPLLAGATTFARISLAFALLLLGTELVVLGPYLFFAGQLFRARAAGHFQYGELALRYSRRFHERWITGPRTQDDSLLGAPDIQSLADMANSFEVVERMRVVPFGPRLIYGVFACATLPMLPLLLTQMSLLEILQKVGHALLGGVH